MNLFVLDTHTIFRRGLVACLEDLAEVESVGEAGCVRDAWEHPSLFASDLVMLDPALPGGRDFVAGVREATGARVLVCASESGREAALGALQAGAVGCLRKDELTPESLACAVRAASNGASVVTPDLLEHLLATMPAKQAPSAPARLTRREQQVLSLIAAGHPTREVALELSYSERTVKNVLHDVVTKLNARSRSHAVASAVREGLI